MDDDQNNSQQKGNFNDLNQRSSAPETAINNNAPVPPQTGSNWTTENTQYRSESKSKKTWKIILIIVIIFVCLGVVAYFLRTKAVIFYQKYALLSRAEKPLMYVKPETHILDTSLEPVTKSDVTVGNLILTTPWSDPVSKKSNGELGSYTFDNGQKILVTMDNENISILDTVNGGDGDYLKNALGGEKFSSAYTATETMLNLTPDDLKITESNLKLAAISTLVTLKSVTTYEADKIYSISSDDHKLFQYGSAGSGKSVMLAFYNLQGKHIFDIGVNGATQQEIDYIISHAKMFLNDAL